MVCYDVKHQYDPNEFLPKNEDEIEITEVKVERQVSDTNVSRDNSIVLGDIPESINRSAVSETKGEKSFRSLSSGTKNDVRMLYHDRMFPYNPFSQEDC
jgi:hypothetical protein